MSMLSCGSARVGGNSSGFGEPLETTAPKASQNFVEAPSQQRKLLALIPLTCNKRLCGKSKARGCNRTIRADIGHRHGPFVSRKIENFPVPSCPAGGRLFLPAETRSGSCRPRELGTYLRSPDQAACIVSAG